MSRPSLFTQELAEDICRQIAEGAALKEICKKKGMPTTETVRVWRRDDAAFSAMYAQAREDQADVFAADIVKIADEETDAAKARNRIDARKWAASKLRPKVYGDKVSLDHSGSIQTVPDEQLDARLAILLGKARTDSSA